MSEAHQHATPVASHPAPRSENDQQQAGGASGEAEPVAIGHTDGTASASTVHRKPAGDSGQERERLKDEARQATDQYLRLLAEFENTKKRLQREKEEFARYAAEGVIRRLLPVMDSLEQALASGRASSPNHEAIIAGVRLIHRQLLSVLEAEGVKRIQAVGEPFDPRRHEAVSQVEAMDESADNTVAEEVQAGYTFHHHVVRPAMVKVAKKTSPRSTVHGPQHADNLKEDAE